jgi:hypothetical protein
MNMCRMKRLRTGTFIRDGIGVEVMGETAVSYDRVLSRGIEFFHIDPKEGIHGDMLLRSGPLIII